MRRSRTLTIPAVLAVGLTTATLAMLTRPSHDEDELIALAPLPQSPGPRADEAVPMPPGLSRIEIALGLDDEVPTEWSGTVEVSEGRVLGLDVIESRPNASIEGNRFRAGSRREVAKKKATAKNKKARNKKGNTAKKKAKAARKAQQDAPIAPTVLRANIDAPGNATVTITTDRGAFEFTLDELARGARKTFLDDQAAVERIDASVRLSGTPTEDDYPAAARAEDGSVWLAYVEYTAERHRLTERVDPEDFDKVLVPRNNGDRILLRRFDGRTWQPPIAVTEGKLDIWRPTVAIDGQGTVHVAWAQQVDGNWDIYRRAYDPARERWGEVVRMTDAPGSDFHVVSATDAKGTVWLAWQGFREGSFDILTQPIAEGEGARAVADNEANQWSPAIAASAKGGVVVAWDTYEAGNYDVTLRRVDQEGSEPIAVAKTARFEARPSLAFDADGHLWIAYEEGDEQWGKDYANANPERVPATQGGFPLYLNRTVRVKCLDTDGTLQQAEGSLDEALPGPPALGKSLPRLAVGPRGGVWMLYRRHPLDNGRGEVWDSFATHHDGRTWSRARRIRSTSNLIDNRPALVPTEAGLLVIHSTDDRQNTNTRQQDDLYATRLVPESGDVSPPPLVAVEPDPEPSLPPVHPDEAEAKARMRAYRVESGGKSLSLLRGDFHRHTEFSSHRDQDGMLEDMWRYGLDAADHDWMGNADHNNGAGFEYFWWIIQKHADLFHNAPRFVAAHSYERSAVYPNGHRNVILPRRGIRPLPFGDLAGTPEEGTPDTKNLYKYLKHFGGICASHTSATNMGTDWRDNDPEVEPVVEIYQGHRHNYEHFGAPRSPTEATQIGGYRPAGFIWNALAKGYRLGFESSSDHVSTHWSYAVVLAEDHSRQAIIDAFKKRHSYAATDNIILDVRSGEHLMGDEFTTDAAPTLEVVARGTSPIVKLHVIRDNKYALTTEPNAEEVEFRYTDDDARPGESHYYYIRVEQADGNLAWASPLWITYRAK